MTRSITKVKTKSSTKRQHSMENLDGWHGVLADIRLRIEGLRNLVPIVERKIRQGEPWPATQSTAHSDEQQHSV